MSTAGPVRPLARPSGRALLRALLGAGTFALLVVFLPGDPAGAGALRAARAVPATPRPATVAPPAVPAGVYLGVDPNFQPTVGEAAQLSQFEGLIGRRVAMASFYLAWDQALPPDMAQIAASGVLPLVSWHCDPHSDQAIIAGTDDATIRAVAESYKSFGRPVLLRWFWEMNLPQVRFHQGCLGLNLPLATQQQDYVAAWRHIWTIFQQVGATNVAFVWCPSAAYGTEKQHPSQPFYPGSAYVNWIGGDLYDRTGDPAFSAVFAPFYGIYAGYGKPMLIGETGAVGSSQAPWLNNAMQSIQTTFKAVHGFLYVDANDIYDYRLLPGSTGLAAYVAIGRSAYFSSYALVPDGYGFATAAGGVHVYDTAYHGDATGQTLPAPIVGFAEDPRGSGYWLVGGDGSIYPFGTARNFGSMRGHPLTRPIVAMAATSDGGGYWFVASDGGIFAFGDARFHGSMGSRHLNRPIVGMASMPTGQGYWLVASDGGMFTFGLAKFRGSTGNIHLNKPIVGMSRTGDGLGYWLVASDGGIFTFGDAHFGGSLASTAVPAPVVSATFNPVTNYYLMLLANGTVYDFPSGQVLSTAKLASSATQIATIG